MPRVIIDPDRTFRWDAGAGRYVEEIETAAGDGSFEDAVAALAQAIQTGARRGEPLKLAFPPRCPHCGGAVTTHRTLAADRGRTAHLWRMLLIDVPTCAKVPRPLVAYFLQIVLIVITVMSAFAVVVTPVAGLFALAGIAANVSLWRARTWITMNPAVGGVVSFDVRDPVYAHALARLNRGRVEGRGPVPELSEGAEGRAPLPQARQTRGRPNR